MSIDDDDLISHPLYEFLEKNERIFINRIDYRTMSYEEEIPYEVEIRTTPLLRNGKSRLLQEGATGKKILTYGETTKDGVVQEAELLGENIVLKPTTQFIWWAETFPFLLMISLYHRKQCANFL